MIIVVYFIVAMFQKGFDISCLKMAKY